MPRKFHLSLKRKGEADLILRGKKTKAEVLVLQLKIDDFGLPPKARNEVSLFLSREGFKRRYVHQGLSIWEKEFLLLETKEKEVLLLERERLDKLSSLLEKEEGV